ncbi:cupin domain-containing protein [Sphingosinicella sp.]|uniref:cupin domain-containing protein n=1 Tax=Sphingosinicella sp. TaxID=1917971 RepID=UPI0017EA91A6|nr:cupin domain-containing protein [Sphingosinicella sp.]MBA4760067.1 cupin domain-containing protein [Sphingosinicella sp.]
MSQPNPAVLPRSIDPVDESFGLRLRQLRTERGLSQRDLARLSGVANTTISLVEKGRISPSLSSIKKILDGLDTTLSAFFSDDLTHEPQTFYRRADLKKLSDGKGISLTQIGWDMGEQAIQIFWGVYAVGGDTGAEMMSHDGEEGGFVVKGVFEVTVGGDVQVLSAGDAYYFSSRKPHRFRNIGAEAGEIISAQSPPSV